MSASPATASTARPGLAPVRKAAAVASLADRAGFGSARTRRSDLSQRHACIPPSRTPCGCSDGSSTGWKLPRAARSGEGVRRSRFSSHVPVLRRHALCHAASPCLAARAVRPRALCGRAIHPAVAGGIHLRRQAAAGRSLDRGRREPMPGAQRQVRALPRSACARPPRSIASPAPPSRIAPHALSSFPKPASGSPSPSPTKSRATNGANPYARAIRLLADSGFGGERSRGWGRAHNPEFRDGKLPQLIYKGTALGDKCHWLFRWSTPAESDQVDWDRGSYSTTVRGGRIESPAGSGSRQKAAYDDRGGFRAIRSHTRRQRSGRCAGWIRASRLSCGLGLLHPRAGRCAPPIGCSRSVIGRSPGCRRAPADPLRKT